MKFDPNQRFLDFWGEDNHPKQKNTAELLKQSLGFYSKLPPGPIEKALIKDRERQRILRKGPKRF